MDEQSERLLRETFGENLKNWDESPLPVQASGRMYSRLLLHGHNVPSSVVLMASAGGSGELGPSSPHNRSTFLELQEFLVDGVPVPRVFGSAPSGSRVLLEDLGDKTMEIEVRERPMDRVSIYSDAVRTLTDMQEWARRKSAEPCICWKRQFDEKLLFDELMHWHEFGLLLHFGARLSAADEREVQDAYRAIVRGILDYPTEFVHRDYQSRNLMVLGGKIRVIDFQDALQGSAAYDLVALLRDSYVHLSDVEVATLMALYCEERGKRNLPVPPQFECLFHLQTLQRKLKDAGRFEFIRTIRKNPNFVVHIPASMNYVKRAARSLAEHESWKTAAESLLRLTPTEAFS